MCQEAAATGGAGCNSRVISRLQATLADGPQSAVVTAIHQERGSLAGARSRTGCHRAGVGGLRSYTSSSSGRGQAQILSHSGGEWSRARRLHSDARWALGDLMDGTCRGVAITRYLPTHSTVHGSHSCSTWGRGVVPTGNPGGNTQKEDTL